MEIWKYGYGSIPINTIFRGMNIHLPAILMWTTGVQGFDTLPYIMIYHRSSYIPMISPWYFLWLAWYQIPKPWCYLRSPEDRRDAILIGEAVRSFDYVLAPAGRKMGEKVLGSFPHHLYWVCRYVIIFTLYIIILVCHFLAYFFMWKMMT